MKPVSKPFYMASMLGGWLVAEAAAVAIALGWPRLLHEPTRAWIFGPSDARVLAGIEHAAGLYLFIVQLVLVYKMWRVVPEAFARTTPGRAVFLLFVPLFNIYWMFQAYWGWTKDFNRFASNRGLRVRRMPEEVALALCLLPLVAVPLLFFVGMAGLEPVMHIAGHMCGVLGAGLTLAMFWCACDGINAAVAAAARDPAGGLPGAAPSGGFPVRRERSSMAVVSVVLGLIGFATFGVTGWAGLYVGVRVLLEIRKGRYSRRDAGWAKAGILVSVAALVLFTPLLVAFGWKMWGAGE